MIIGKRQALLLECTWRNDKCNYILVCNQVYVPNNIA